MTEKQDELLTTREHEILKSLPSLSDPKLKRTSRVFFWIIVALSLFQLGILWWDHGWQTFITVAVMLWLTASTAATHVFYNQQHFYAGLIQKLRHDQPDGQIGHGTVG